MHFVKEAGTTTSLAHGRTCVCSLAQPLCGGARVCSRAVFKRAGGRQEAANECSAVPVRRAASGYRPKPCRRRVAQRVLRCSPSVQQRLSRRGGTRRAGGKRLACVTAASRGQQHAARGAPGCAGSSERRAPKLPGRQRGGMQRTVAAPSMVGARNVSRQR